MTWVLVINSGSSSLKYQLIDPVTGDRAATGLIERIGEPQANLTHRAGDVTRETVAAIRDHRDGFRALRDAFADAGQPLADLDLVAVGHRVVQGGDEFVAPTVITEQVAERILQLGELAPLHNPPQHQAIVAAQAAFPTVPHVAVFDTAYHQTMPPAATTIAIDSDIAAAHGVRRYGFHGTSHQVVARRAATLLGRPLDDLKLVVLHLGNGASACAVEGGRSIDTSMGMTPLEGLVMGTRGGDIDPGALLHLLRRGFSADDLDDLLNHHSGLAGLSGTGDMRDVLAAAATGSERARRALDVYVHRVRHYLGAYLLELGGADAIVFTAGVGERSAAIRAAVCADLAWFGIVIHPERNAAGEDARVISTDESRVAVLVVPTDEEAEIARQAWELVRAR